jgi:hypothetical protein
MRNAGLKGFPELHHQSVNPAHLAILTVEELLVEDVPHQIHISLR